MVKKQAKRAASRPGPWIRRAVEQVHAYVPGEQLKRPGLIKLNTNENPYPPSPRVLEAVREAVDGRLRLYPNPTSQLVRDKLGKLHGCGAERVVVTNGSDDFLALAVRAFVEEGEARVGRSRKLVQYFTPSYSLYPVLADIHGAVKNPVSLNPDFGIPSRRTLLARGWDPDAALSFVTTPNAPGGRGYKLEELEMVCRMTRGVVVLDEAYVDFASGSAMELALRYPHVMVARTFSKAYSLCFQRVGYGVGDERLIRALDSIRDSYNVNGLGQVAALATLSDLGYYRQNFRRVKATRKKVSRALGKLGFEVLPSETNFILARPPGQEASVWFEALKERDLLVRWFSASELRGYLRITIGTADEMERFVGVCAELRPRMDANARG
ncbi:MAG: Histidinol-phosphate aminotransferase [Verrucomicrobiota bacterium]|jgi:histidinol-phosphate aminotransferase